MQRNLTVLIALLMSLALSTSAFAQDAPEEEDPAEGEAATSDEPGDTDEAEPSEDEPAPEAEEGASEEGPAETSDSPPPEAQAAASETVPKKQDDHPARDASIVVAPHAGVTFPQLTSELQTWPIFGLELGYMFDFDVGSMERPLQVGLDVMYTQPSSAGTGDSSNLGGTDGDGADYSYDLTQQMLILELYGLWRFMPAGDTVSAYGLLGPRAYLMRSIMEARGNGGESFGTNYETKTQIGLVAGGGVDVALGPGTMFAALEFGWSDLKERITGDSNTGALVLDLGYRLYF